MVVEWSILKGFVDDRNLSVQWVDFGSQYELLAFDGNFSLESSIDKSIPSSELTDFENNYKSLGNTSPKNTTTVSNSLNVGGTVNTNLNGLINFQTSQYTIGTSSSQITVIPLSTRSSLSIKVITTSGNIIYVGNNSGVTTSTGYPLFNGDSLQLDLNSTQQIWLISNAASQTACVIEIGS